MRSSIKNRFCDKKRRVLRYALIYCLTNTLATSQRSRCGRFFARAKEEKLLKKKRKEERGERKGRAIRAAITLALSRRKSRDGVADRTWIFHVCSDRRASETRGDTATGRECGERRDSHRAARARARTRAAEHLFEMIPRCLIAQADIIPRAGKRDDFKQRKPPGEA